MAGEFIKSSGDGGRAAARCAFRENLPCFGVRRRSYSPGRVLEERSLTLEAYSLGLIPVAFLKWREK